MYIRWKIRKSSDLMMAYLVKSVWITGKGPRQEQHYLSSIRVSKLHDLTAMGEFLHVAQWKLLDLPLDAGQRYEYIIQLSSRLQEEWGARQSLLDARRQFLSVLCAPLYAVPFSLSASQTCYDRRKGA